MCFIVNVFQFRRRTKYAIRQGSMLVGKWLVSDDHEANGRVRGGFSPEFSRSIAPSSRFATFNNFCLAPGCSRGREADSSCLDPSLTCPGLGLSETRDTASPRPGEAPSAACSARFPFCSEQNGIITVTLQENRSRLGGSSLPLGKPLVSIVRREPGTNEKAEFARCSTVSGVSLSPPRRRLIRKLFRSARQAACINCFAGLLQVRSIRVREHQEFKPWPHLVPDPRHP
jgi:hypothetical protein